MNRFGKLNISVIVFMAIAIAAGITIGWLLTKDDTGTELSSPKILAKDYQLQQNINRYMELQASNSSDEQDDYRCANILYGHDQVYAYAWVYCSGFSVNRDGRTLTQEEVDSLPVRFSFNPNDLQIISNQQPDRDADYDKGLQSLFLAEIYSQLPPSRSDIAQLDYEIGGKALAVLEIKGKYPELADYPSNNLPPRSIAVEFDGQYYAAFIQNGSGVPMISARCFAIATDLTVTEIGSFEPVAGQSPALNISAKTCQPVS